MDPQPQTATPSRNSWTTVTPLSKALALILFITLPIGMFFLGMYVQSQSTPAPTPQTTTAQPTASPISPTPDETAGWKSYSTTGTFGLTSEILQEYPTLAKGNLAFKYPSNWKLVVSKPTFSNEKKYGVFLGVSLGKEHPNYQTTGGEGPDNYSASVDFKIKVTDLDPNQIANDYANEFGTYSIEDKPVLNQTFNGKVAAKIVRGQALYPTAVIFSISPTTVMDIHTDFYDLGKEPLYSQTTIKEINEILNSVTIVP